MARLSQLCIAIFIQTIATHFGRKGPSSGITQICRENYFAAPVTRTYIKNEISFLHIWMFYSAVKLFSV